MSIQPVNEPGIDIPVHAVAALFPMMDDATAGSLGADIKDVGQLEPCIYMATPEHPKVLLDGRNRYRECRKLGIEPRMELYAGQPGREGEYILSRNIIRRHLDAGQVAVVVTQAYPILAEEAAARKKATQFAAGNTESARGGLAKAGKLPVTLSLGSPAASEAPTRDHAKKHANSTAGQISVLTKGEVSRYNAERAGKLVSLAPALAAEVVRGHVKFRDAMRQIKPARPPILTLELVPPPPPPPAPPPRNPLELPREQPHFAQYLIPAIVCVSLCAGLGFALWQIFS